jgi:hypothetical protein
MVRSHDYSQQTMIDYIKSTQRTRTHSYQCISKYQNVSSQLPRLLEHPQPHHPHSQHVCPRTRLRYYQSHMATMDRSHIMQHYTRCLRRKHQIRLKQHVPCGLTLGIRLVIHRARSYWYTHSRRCANSPGQVALPGRSKISAFHAGAVATFDALSLGFVINWAKMERIRKTKECLERVVHDQFVRLEHIVLYGGAVEKEAQRKYEAIDGGCN